jgi:hypothetical protein
LLGFGGYHECIKFILVREIGWKQIKTDFQTSHKQLALLLECVVDDKLGKLQTFKTRDYPVHVVPEPSVRSWLGAALVQFVVGSRRIPVVDQGFCFERWYMA